MWGFVSKSRYIITVSGIALILESRDSSALFLLYGDIYNKYMYINQQKKQDQKGKLTQTDTLSQGSTLWTLSHFWHRNGIQNVHLFVFRSKT